MKFPASSFPAVILCTLAACSSSTLATSTQPDASVADAETDGAALDQAYVPPEVISTAPWTAAETDPTLAVGSDGTLAAAWLTTAEISAVGYSFSRDGGVTWSAPGQIDPGSGHAASDPWLVSDGSGGFYTVWTPVAIAAAEADGVALAHATGSPLSFGAPMVASDTSKTLYYDQPEGLPDRNWRASRGLQPARERRGGDRGRNRSLA